MPYNRDDQSVACTVCRSDSNQRPSGVDTIVDCVCCGDFRISRVAIDDIGLPYQNGKDQALASYVVRRKQAAGSRPTLTTEFFNSLNHRNLPSPAEQRDNFIIWLAGQADGMPGQTIKIPSGDPVLRTIIGVVNASDIHWMVYSIKSKGLFNLGTQQADTYTGTLTIDGWERFEELKRAHTSSNYAFFARKFTNADIDAAFEKCLRPAVEETGYELSVRILIV